MDEDSHATKNRNKTRTKKKMIKTQLI